MVSAGASTVEPGRSGPPLMPRGQIPTVGCGSSHRKVGKVERTRFIDRFIRTATLPSMVALLVVVAMTDAVAATRLDTTFDGDGLRFTSFAGSASAEALALQPDGKIVLVGTRQAGDSDFAVARYMPDGELDASFDNDGKATIAFGGAAEASDVAIQPDGAIVVVGVGGDGFAIARLRADGQLDGSFSNDGRKVIKLGASSAAKAVAVTPTGKLLIGGDIEQASSGSTFGLVQLRSNGPFDAGFGGGDGVVSTPFPDRPAFLRALTIGPSGEIVAAGHVFDPDRNSLFALANYHSDGTLDDSFGGDGRVTTAVSTDAGANDVALTDAGKVVAGGDAFFVGLERSQFTLVRYKASGRLDTTFGGDGKVTTAFGGFDSEASIDDLELVGSKIVAAGPSFFADDAFQTARYRSDGSLDPLYGEGGRFRVSLPAAAEGTGLGVTPDGRYVVGGTLFGSTSNRFVVARLIP
jgi:uncharacterized delta-60 repeat protein